MDLKPALQTLRRGLMPTAELSAALEPLMLLQGRMAADAVKARPHIRSLADAEFKVFSQWGDDGIIQWLVHHLPLRTRTFIEFGVEDYREANTRFLMINDNWSGLVMDGSPANVQAIQSAGYYWQHELQARCAFIDRDNINGLIEQAGFSGEVGILHIDLDGNDYWIWQAIRGISPELVILEYNAVFGAERAITTPYDPQFRRTAAHHSNLYFGASLAALVELSRERGYAFVGCNSAGNNAYFVRRDRMDSSSGLVRELAIAEGYIPSRFSESRDTQGHLTHVRGAARLELIRGLPVWCTRKQQMEAL